jgi:hypothetical protein
MTGPDALNLWPLLPRFTEPYREDCSVVCGHPDFCPELVFCKEVHQPESKGPGRRNIEACRKADTIIAYREEIDPVSFMKRDLDGQESRRSALQSNVCGNAYLKEFVTSSLTRMRRNTGILFWRTQEHARAERSRERESSVCAPGEGIAIVSQIRDEFISGYNEYMLRNFFRPVHAITITLYHGTGTGIPNPDRNGPR